VCSPTNLSYAGIDFDKSCAGALVPVLARLRWRGTGQKSAKSFSRCCGHCLARRRVGEAATRDLLPAAVFVADALVLFRAAVEDATGGAVALDQFRPTLNSLRPFTAPMRCPRPVFFAISLTSVPVAGMQAL
jgi:hypothetical protein